ncbi:MAG: YdeI/OmpD-associated family protein [Ignavibacteriales bacterium]|nr:YdeI/OmpD-associated family protein [Ignavibacteriales bacterium]
MISNQLKDKFKIKYEYTFDIINAPIGFNKSNSSASKSAPPFNCVLLFVQSAKELQKQTPKAFRNLKEDGIFWISYPKSSSEINIDLNRDECWNIMKKFGHRAVSQISIDETWSAMRFKPIEKVRSKKIEIPYIDTEKCIVRVPSDLEIAFKKNKKAEEFFKSLSYTHRKEYVVWIESAKKEETRSARVTKTIDLLTKGIKDR